MLTPDVAFTTVTLQGLLYPPPFVRPTDFDVSLLQVGDEVFASRTCGRQCNHRDIYIYMIY